MTRFPDGNVNKDVALVADNFATRMSGKGFNLDFSLSSLENEIDKIFEKEAISSSNFVSETWKNQAGLEAYIGQTLALLYDGTWKGQFSQENPGPNFYLSYVEFGEFRCYPSHYVGYRLSNGVEDSGTFKHYLEKLVIKITKRKKDS